MTDLARSRPLLDRPQETGTDVELAVVGAGASATFLLAQLRLRWVGDLPRTALIEKGRCPGPGVAYRTTDPRHRMNVRACQLSAFPDEPDDFVRWVAGERTGTTREDYLPRALYGRYLRAVFDEATAPPARVDRVTGTVTGVRPDAGGVVLVGERGLRIRAAHVVLAVGVPPTAASRFDVDPGLVDDGRYVDDPWGPSGLQGALGRQRVVLVGSGLTTVDVALTLLGTRGTREVVAVSTSGELPASHPRVRREAQHPIGRPETPTAAAVVRWLRELGAVEPGGWEAAVDAVRWHAGDVWDALPLEEQARLLRLGGSRWSRLRHRMAPEVADDISAARAARRLRTCTGRVRAVRRGAGGVEVHVGRRHGENLVLAADAVVNCAGPPGVWASGDPVVRELVDSGTVGVGAHGLGLAVAPDGAALDPGGRPLPGLSVLGALRRGTELEATAVPELRQQAEQLVRRLVRAGALRR